MTTGLLLDNDQGVSEFIRANYGKNWPPLYFDRALGVIGNDGKLAGGVVFQNWNRSNVDVSYYGRNTLTPGIIRCLARIIISTFDPSRVTVMTSKRNRRLIDALQKLGFGIEGAQRCFYGHRDCPRNTAIRCVMFRERVNQIARIEQAKAS